MTVVLKFWVKFPGFTGRDGRLASLEVSGGEAGLPCEVATRHASTGWDEAPLVLQRRPESCRRPKCAEYPIHSPAGSPLIPGPPRVPSVMPRYAA